MSSTGSNFILVQPMLFRSGLGHRDMNWKNNSTADVFDLRFVFVYFAWNISFRNLNSG